ncbi:MAG: BPSS1780 family membrane protein [Pseudomonadota bacterium]
MTEEQNSQTSTTESTQVPEPRGNAIGAGWTWIAAGFDLFKPAWLIWIVNFILFVVVMAVLSLVPLIGQVATLLLSPVLIGGLMLGAQAVDRGEELTVGHLFAGFSKNSGQLVLVGLLYGVFLFLSVIPGAVIMMLGGLSAGSTGQAGAEIGFLAALGILVMLLFVIPVIMAYWFAPVLVVLNDKPAIEAMKLSFKGCLKNILPFLWYGIIGLLLYIVALIPLGLGVFVVAPVLIASMYTAYKGVFLGN